MSEHELTELQGGKEEIRQKTEHACAYCGINSPSCVVRCYSCKRWFCNSKEGASISHIVKHLKTASHNVISFYRDSEIGDTVLQCCKCSCKNVFVLGSVPVGSSHIFLCRIPCLFAEEANWNSKEWQPLIESCKFRNSIVQEPGADEKSNARSVRSREILKLEAQWKRNKDVTINDIHTAKRRRKKIPPAPSIYKNACEYRESFAPLIKMAADYDKTEKESQVLENISITWSLGATKHHHLASFEISTSDPRELEVALCDRMLLHYTGPLHRKWSGEGQVLRKPNALRNTVTLGFRSSVKPPTHICEGFTAKFIWTGTPYNNMQNALEKFAFDEKSMSRFLFPRLLGHQVDEVHRDIALPKEFSIPSFVSLNASQSLAVESALRRPFSLIQGPPGTGKTVTSATIVYHLSQTQKNRILVCAPSNVAVDHIAMKLVQLSLKVVRLVARNKEDMYNLDFALHNLIFKSAPQELKELIKLKEAGHELSHHDHRNYVRKMKIAEAAILKDADVVCCTCVGAGDVRLRKERFTTVLIDESAQALEAECLVPLIKGANHVVLVGDHQQLGPVVLGPNVGKAGLERSLFKRLISLGHVPLRLQVQYRMNPHLSEFPNNAFYEGKLQNGVTERERTLPNCAFLWPTPRVPMMFWAHSAGEEISSNGTSSLNSTEAIMCERIIFKLFQNGIRPEQIGVITSYKGQTSYILQYMQLLGSRRDHPSYSGVEVASVNAFQGREKDFIIFSCVRSNHEQVLGFLNDPRRLNVALTRAKYGLIVLGNPTALSKDSLWNDLLVHFKERACLVEGPLDNLRPCRVRLSQKGSERSTEAYRTKINKERKSE